MGVLKHSKEKFLSVTSILGNLLLILTLMNASLYADSSPGKSETMTMDYYDEKLTVAIHSVPLKQVIQDFSQSTGIEVLWQGGEVERRIGMRFTHLSPDEAVRRILRGENYILYYNSNKKEKRLEKILVLSREGKEEKAMDVPSTVSEPQLYAMTKGDGQEMPDWHEMESDSYDNYDLIESLEEHLLEQGNIDDLEKLKSTLFNMRP